MRPNLEVYQNGTKASLSECLSFTLTEQLLLCKLSESAKFVLFSFNYGLDGSGQHSDYSQQSKSHFSTQQIINVCFALSSIKKSDGTILWSSATKGHNSPQNVRPLALFPSKENDDMLREFIPSLDTEVKTIKENGLKLCLPNGQLIIAKIETESMSMCDGKMIVRLLQLGGSYCTMCHHSQSQCHDPSFISSEFIITLTVESIHQLALSLQDSESEQIKKAPGDYQEPQGVTGTPLTSANLASVIPVCHAKIHTFDWVVNCLMVKINSHQEWHSATNPVCYTIEEKTNEKNARESLKESLKNSLGINIGDAKDMVT